MNTDEFITYQEATFDACCKRLIQNEGKNARREIARRESREVTFSALSQTVTAKLSYTDSYFEGFMRWGERERCTISRPDSK